MEPTNETAKQLVQLIRERIVSSGLNAISFHDYMKMCLYEPLLGYYMSNRDIIGKQGDFYTSSAVGTVMGEMLGKYIVKLIDLKYRECALVSVVEFGGGTGRLAKQLLDAIKSNSPDCYAKLRFFSVETGPHHHFLQRESLNEHNEIVNYTSEEQWIGSGHENTIIYSNELLDAFPVHRIEQRNGQLFEHFTSWDDRQECFCNTGFPCTNEEVLRHLEQEHIPLLEGQIAEMNLNAVKWVQRVGKSLKSGSLITIDYGDVAQELYGAHRMNGTLMCYRQHRAFDNPYIHAGEQDITAHINFSACIRAGETAGFSEWRLLTQKQFLMEAGVLEMLQNHNAGDPFDPIARKNRSIRQLLLSDEMSELFKVLIQHKEGG